MSGANLSKACPEYLSPFIIAPFLFKLQDISSTASLAFLAAFLVASSVTSLAAPLAAPLVANLVAPQEIIFGTTFPPTLTATVPATLPIIISLGPGIKAAAIEFPTSSCSETSALFSLSIFPFASKAHTSPVLG
ncbi:hypothetical protein ACULTG_001622 [Listeria monocytogenes]|nr:hypothetical protein [Listeria monocytogenes]EIZ2716089.1 hypothetical protein [Listeria monocytogenes]EIZ2718966.1 hypothetical protein [Listeria monocytogenes]EIZ2736240.1 hypothetical protein [Listeria monocytogenes]EIZ3974776.1 hypothetical protein [Listeria monocytogenes]